MVERSVVNVLDVKVDAVDTEELYRKVLRFAQKGIPSRVMYFNAHCAVISHKDGAYRKILNSADLVYADGTSIVLASGLFGTKLPKRSTAADFMLPFCRGFATNGLKIFLLGSQREVVEEAERRMSECIPELRIVGTHHGYFSNEENGRVLETIRETGPDILLVGLGVPYQEKWIEEHHEYLGVPVIWGVGGLFDFLSGRLRRGPKLLVDNGFEWLCRLAIEPRRLWKRYVLGNLRFSWLVIRQRMMVRQ